MPNDFPYDEVFREEEEHFEQETENELWWAKTVPPQPKYTLNAGQQAVLDTLVPICLSPTISLYKCLLEGWAGTGKTFVINRLVEAVKAINPRINFGMTAPTHKAVRQLKRHSELKDEIEFGTIHSFLMLKEKLVKDPKNPHKMVVTYEPDFEAKRERKLDGIQVLIVDESSMLGSLLYGYLDDACRNRPDLKVIFMGDALQIPPVNEKNTTGVKDAIPFVEAQRKSRKIEYLVLSEIIRQKAGNPIIEYSKAIRDQFQQQSINWNGGSAMMLGGPTGVQLLPRQLPALREIFSRYFDTDEFRADADYVKVIAWRNDTVNYFNTEIRQLLYKRKDLPKILVGEKMIMDKPLVQNDKIVIPNNEEVEIVEMEEGVVPVKYEIKQASDVFTRTVEDQDPFADKRKVEVFKVYKCKVKLPEGKVYTLSILHEDAENRYKQLRDQMSSAAEALSRSGQIFESKDMWKQFFILEKYFAWLKYNYCVTAHKAQGSTYDYCISMEWDIDEGKKIVGIEEANRIRYVAATRARNKLFIVK